MQIFLFDLLPFDRHFDAFKAGRHMPFPLPGSYFDPEVAARSYEQHLAVWEEMDRLGYDGVGLNEHHTTPHGLMNSPNMALRYGLRQMSLRPVNAESTDWRSALSKGATRVNSQSQLKTSSCLGPCSETYETSRHAGEL